MSDARPLRILILSQYYAPEPIPKPVELAEALVERGHAVTVVTGVPNYPSGTLYPGYRLGWQQRETIHGVPVVRTYEYPYHGLHALGRAANYFSFAASASFAGRTVGPVDVIYVWHPPLTVGIAAWQLGRACRAPFVYDVQDIWPDAAIDAGAFKPGAVTAALHRLERFVYRRAAHVITATGPARQNLIDKGVAPDKVTALPHWIDVEAWQPPAGERNRTRAELGWDGRFVALFAGNLGVLQALDTIVEAAQHFRPGEPFLIALVGDGSERARLEALVAARGWGDRVQWLARRGPSEVPRLFGAADALVVHLKRSGLAHWTVPTKTLAYLASGTPVIVAAEGPSAAMVQEAEAGLAVPPESPEALAAAIRALAAHGVEERAAIGARGRAYARTHLSGGHVIPQYEALLRRAAMSARA